MENLPRILIAIDSFKGCLSSFDAGLAIKKGVLEFAKSVEVVPIADGGEGSVEAMSDALNAKFKSVLTLDPLGREILSTYAYTENLAIMEMASSSGLTLLKDSEKNPLITSTFGLGLMIKDALNLGIREFVIGIGGSATNDAGSGMLEALGFEFFDKDGGALKMCGKNLSKVAKISGINALLTLKEANFKIACDVNNPLFGENGAAYIYGPQKGADENMVKVLDAGLESFAKVTSKFNGSDNAHLSGAGAAGGLGFGFVSFLNAKLLPGFEIISKAVNLEEKIKNSDLVITGEGRLDKQTMMGKTPSMVAKMAKKHGVKVIAFGGSVAEDALNLNELIGAYFSIQQNPVCLEEAMRKGLARKNLESVANQALRLYLLR